jgi:tetratricopeptide (TPR) repeat protein
MRYRFLPVCLTVAAGCAFDPGGAQQALMQANMRAFQKDYLGAIGLYDQALIKDPSLAEAVFSRGIAYRARGNFDRALADIDQALDMGLVGSRVLAERARTKLEKVASEAAGDTSKLAAAFGKDDPLGIAADLDQAVRWDGKNEDAIALLLHGALRIMQNRDADAKSDFDRFLIDRPKARPDLELAIEKWQKERPVLDLSSIDELARIAAHQRGVR